MATFLGSIWLAGCGGTDNVREEPPKPDAVVNSYLADKPSELHPLYSKVINEGNHNLVLNQMHAGLAAFDLGYISAAEHSFDQALNQIESVYANNPNAEKARSLWYSEKVKDFKGEPYERCMAYYYRGLLDMQKGDYENARASFKGGVIQDAFAEEKQNRSDFALLLFLQGWSSQMLGDEYLMNEAYKELKTLRPDFELPAKDHDTLVIVETGKSPRKLSDGVGHYELVYRPGKRFKEKKALVSYAGQEIMAYPMESIYFQATTRGGRPVDRIIQGKLEFKKNTETFGSVLSDVGNTGQIGSTLLSSGSQSIGNAGAALGLIGGVSMMISANANPEADTRYWKNLPDIVHVYTFKRNAKDRLVNVQFLQKDKTPVQGMRASKEIQVDQSGKGFVWIRSRSAQLK